MRCRNHGLSQRESAVIGRHFGMQEDFESSAAQRGDAPAEKICILKRASAQADSVQPIRSPNPDAHLHNNRRDGVMKFCGHHTSTDCVIVPI